MKLGSNELCPIRKSGIYCGRNSSGRAIPDNVEGDMDPQLDAQESICPISFAHHLRCRATAM